MFLDWIDILVIISAALAILVIGIAIGFEAGTDDVEQVSNSAWWSGFENGAAAQQNSDKEIKVVYMDEDTDG